MTTLGSVTLSGELILDGLESCPLIAHSVRRTMGVGSRAVIQSVAIGVAGRELTLSGGSHFTLAIIQDLQTLARLNQPVELVHQRGVYSVLITKIEAEPEVSFADPTSDDFYSAVIYMVEV